ncbi:protein-serine/threonine phosphatase [Malassezia nana]|uniref:Protein-serine/threonine phosphatase n=1 Tax=Malassezia nana TaxID=180528 RepID=A0AAF0J2Q7_9BASI|nr:protein-serine/threonine phosphatase [Malassezia nana]
MDAERDAPPRASTSALPTVEDLVQSRRARMAERPPSRAPVARVPRGLSSVIQQTPKVLVLDLDETLIHSKLSVAPMWGRLSGGDLLGARVSTAFLNLLGLGATVPAHAQLQLRVIEVQIEGRTVVYQVYKRPWVDYFLRKVAAWYQVVIFTASMREYADPVIDWLDGGHGLISGRLFRDSCTLRNGSYLKNLQVVEQDLSRVCLIDNSPISYVLQEANGIPVEAPAGFAANP